MLIDKDESENCFISQINTIETVTEDQIVAIDGKTNCDTRDKASGQSPIHVVSAGASENRITPRMKAGWSDAYLSKVLATV